MAFLKIDSPALNQSAPSWETVVEINSEDGWIMQKKSFFFLYYSQNFTYTLPLEAPFVLTTCSATVKSRNWKKMNQLCILEVDDRPFWNVPSRNFCRPSEHLPTLRLKCTSFLNSLHLSIINTRISNEKIVKVKLDCKYLSLLMHNLSNNSKHHFRFSHRVVTSYRRFKSKEKYN